MLINKLNREELFDLFQVIKLQSRNAYISKDNEVKIEQILAYLEIIHAELRKVSRKRTVVLVDSGAGNCYLSFLVYYFYQHIEQRSVKIHCIDTNERLMQLNNELAQRLNFTNMHFHSCDIENYDANESVDVVYSLHACDRATDKSIHLGVRTKAKVILSVSCCQHSLSLKSSRFKAVLRHQSFRDKTLMMIADSMRALLLEHLGYKVGIFDFVSSRYTEKNTMIRARRSEFKKQLDNIKEYKLLRREFGLQPYLEVLIDKNEVAV